MALAIYDDPQRLAPPATIRTNLPDGGILLRSPMPLEPYARCVGRAQSVIDLCAGESAEHKAPSSAHVVIVE